MTPSAPSRRHLLLILSREGWDPKSAALVARSRHRFHKAFVPGPAGGAPTVPAKVEADDALSTWLRMGSELGPACLGVVAGLGAPATAVSEIVTRGARNGTLPGAVALLGYRPDLVDAWLQAAPDQRQGSDGVWPWAGRRGTADRPPVLILLASDDPSLVECASACRRFRAAGFDMRLEVTGPTSRESEACAGSYLDAGSVEELDAFFEANLEQGFPHMPQDTS